MLPALAQSAAQDTSMFKQAEQAYKAGHVLAARRMLASLLRQPGAQPSTETYCLYAETYLGDLEQSEASLPGAREAERGLLQAIKVDPESGRAYKDLANFCNSRGDYNTAVVYGTKAIEAKKPDANGWLHRSMAYSHLKQPEKALADINQYIKTGKPEPLQYMLRGDILLVLGRYSEALPNFRQSFEGNSGFQVLLLHKIVTCLEKQHKYKEAISELDAWLKVDKENAQIFALRGQMKKELKDYPAAISDYSEAISLEPTAKFYKDRAQLYTIVGSKELAAKDLHSAEN